MQSVMETAASPEMRTPPFFRRLDWAAFWTATLIALAVFGYTLAPTVTLEDAGELAVAADTLGVPHPPGYPIWTMISWVFARVFSFVTFRGQPNPAWGVGLVSVVFGALAAGLGAMLICRSGAAMLASSRQRLHQVDAGAEGPVCFVAGVAASLLFAFSPVMWSQSVIIEVYSLNAFFLLLVFLLTYWWMERPGNRLLYLTAFVFGLGLTNYQVLLLAAAPLVVAILLRQPALLRDTAMAGLPFLVGLIAIQTGGLPARPGLPRQTPLAFMTAAQADMPVTAYVTVGALMALVIVACLVAMPARVQARWGWRRYVPAALAIAALLMRLAMIRVTVPWQMDDGGAMGWTPYGWSFIAGAALTGYLLIRFPRGGMAALAFFAGCVTLVVLAVKGVLTGPALLGGPRYLALALALYAWVAMCVILAHRPAGRRWPLAPTAILAVAAVMLVYNLSAVAAPPALSAAPGQDVFTWGAYDALFALCLIGAATLCLFVRRGAWAALALGAMQITVYTLLRRGAFMSFVSPHSLWFWTYIMLNAAILLIVFVLLPYGAKAALTILAAELGVAFYLYMPLVSDLRNPPMNWGYPRTWEGFKHAISRGQYERIQPVNVLSWRFVEQIGDYLSDLRGQFTLPVALLGFLPFTAWEITVRGKRWKALYTAIGLLALASVLLLLEQWLHLPLRIDKAVTAGIILLLLMGGASIVVSLLSEFVDVARDRTAATASERLTVGLALLGVVAGYLGYMALLAVRIGQVTAPLREAADTTNAGQAGALLAQAGGLVVLMLLPALLMGLLFWMRHSRLNFRMSFDRNSEKWIVATLLGFAVMSVMLIALANPKGDIQDAFIQRVKFISSHALYALWIGYGLIFALAVVDTVARRWGRRQPALARRLLILGLGGAALLPLVPIGENLHNRELIRRYGGAEQNGHDFGWQFGNYQLRGAAAIQEELAPDEEPLPNPLFPAAMGRDAIFFGGTDPGRFVPTYMIYGAKVREDVYLITQNALADNTYMAVMRDLYGDRIWIPAQPDSAKAFQRYVEEVQAGKRPRNAQLTIEGGRVQVSGALGVMEINGILARMIAERNSHRHDFYIEESYVIPWMYPYLEPHGLIMKIHPKPTSLTPATTRDDAEFWDWYTRRLLDDRRFRRDVVARKSFSKLRSAIAGMYASTGRLAEAENAFREAVALYPLSPEANFRLVQEVLMRQQRYAEAQALMRAFADMDPNNRRVDDFLAHLGEIQRLTNRVETLETALNEGRLDVTQALELAQLYRQVGRQDRFAQLCRNMLADDRLPPIFQLNIAQLYHSAGMLQEMKAVLDHNRDRLPDDTPPQTLLAITRMYAALNDGPNMIRLLKRYLALQPDDWRGRIDLAILKVGAGDTDAARRTLNEALRQGGAEARELVASDARLAPLLSPATTRREPAPDIFRIPGVLPGATSP